MNKESVVTLGVYNIKRVDTQEEQHKIFSFRYEPMVRAGIVDANPEQKVMDDFDFAKNVGHYVLTNNSKVMVAAHRAVLYLPKNGFFETPAFRMHSKIIIEALGKDISFVEATRLVVDHTIKSNDSVDVFLAIFRGVLANAIFHKVDYILTVVNKRHVLFYKKLFRAEALSDEMPCLGSNLPGVLLALNLANYFETINNNQKLDLLHLSFDDAQVLAIPL